MVQEDYDAVLRGTVREHREAKELEARLDTKAKHIAEAILRLGHLLASTRWVASPLRGRGLIYPSRLYLSASISLPLGTAEAATRPPGVSFPSPR